MNNDKTEPKIEQWWLNALKDVCVEGHLNQLICQSLARHAPTNQPAPSIWRPVSQPPSSTSSETYCVTDGKCIYWRPADCINYCTGGFWCVASDLLALAPLPKEKTRAEKDAEMVDTLLREYNGAQLSDKTALERAIAYGRATAKGAAQ